VFLAVLEPVTISAYDAATDSDHATWVENLYRPPIMLIGIGLIVAVVAVLSRGTAAWTGPPWLPALVLALGVYVFVPITPPHHGVFAAGRLEIGGWMLLFAAFGYGLTRMDGCDR
jgi:hypothetical protein